MVAEYRIIFITENQGKYEARRPRGLIESRGLNLNLYVYLRIHVPNVLLGRTNRTPRIGYALLSLFLEWNMERHSL